MFPQSVKVTPEEKPLLSPTMQNEARAQGASHTTKDGKRIYVKRFGDVLQADWNGKSYGGWWNTGKDTIPSEAMKT